MQCSLPDALSCCAQVDTLTSQCDQLQHQVRKKDEHIASLQAKIVSGSRHSVDSLTSSALCGTGNDSQQALSSDPKLSALEQQLEVCSSASMQVHHPLDRVRLTVSAAHREQHVAVLNH